MEMEKRLIDADALLQQIEKKLQKYDGEKSDYIGGRCSGLDMAREMVENADAVEAAEARGRWEIRPHPYRTFYPEYCCSACGGWKHKLAYEHENMNYCPNCGAKMDGERSEGE